MPSGDENAVPPAGTGLPPKRFTVCREDDPVPPALAGAVAALGNFDGVHRGHCHLLDIAKREAKTRGLPAGVLTFEPHPRDFFRPDPPAFRLTPEPVKRKVLGAFGIEIVFQKRFDAALAGTSAAGFVEELGTLGLAAIVIGGDFHFGRGREGNPALLAELGSKAGIDVLVQPMVEGMGAPVSSSRIRAALAEGDVATANDLLGYRWFVTGEVRHGQKLGRTLGFPTANIALPPGSALRHGIYAVRVAVAPGEIYEGVASYGRRPTVDDGAPLFETWIFDFAGDLYGRTIEVELVGWIRPEEKLASVEALTAAVHRDAEAARAILAAPPPGPSLIG